MKKLILGLTAALLAATFVISSQAGEKPLISVDDAWVREAPPGVQILAAYMTIHNQSEQDDALTGVSSDCCKKIEMHESVMHSGAMTMQQHDKVSLPAGTCVEFAAGGLHLMLFNPVKPLRDGDKISMTLHFARHAPLTVNAMVKRATGGEEHHHHHQ